MHIPPDFTISELWQLKRYATFDIFHYEEYKDYYNGIKLEEFYVVNTDNIKQKELEILPQKCPYIQWLTITGFWVQEIPDTLQDLKYLKYLKIYNTRISEIPDFVFKYPKLSHFYIEHNKHLKNISENIGQLLHLKELSISNNDAKMINIPESIGHLQKLEELHITYQENLEQIPESIAFLPKLKTLYLYNNHIISLPPAFYQLPNIPFEKIDLNHNPINKQKEEAERKKWEEEQEKEKIRIETQNKIARQQPCGLIITPTQAGVTYEGTGIAPIKHPLAHAIDFETQCQYCKKEALLIVYARFNVHPFSGDKYWDYTAKCTNCTKETSNSYAEN